MTETWQATRAASFAAAVARRHATRAQLGDAVAPRLARIHARLAHGVAPRVGGALTFAPRIELRLTTFGRRADVERAGVVGESVREVHAIRRVTAEVAQPVLDRSVARGVRAEAAAASDMVRRRSFTSAARGDRTTPALATALAPAVQRVLRRQPPIVVDTPAPPRRDEWSARTSTPTARTAELSPVEVNRLTDHIVQTIDRRVAAFRERKGRV